MIAGALLAGEVLTIEQNVTLNRGVSLSAFATGNSTNVVRPSAIEINSSEIGWLARVRILQRTGVASRGRRSTLRGALSPGITLGP